MTLTDAVPLFALVDKAQKHSARCLAILPSLPFPLLMTWPCFTEAMYLVHSAGGWPMQRLLWRYVAEGVLQIHLSSDAEIVRMKALMDKYKDTPMDLADASLVSAAEVASLWRVFTLDSHFYAYRTANGKAFEVVP